MVRRDQRSHDRADEARGLSERTVGLLWLAGGSAVTFITYASASPGGVYVVAWGAMLYGAVKLLGSLAEVADSEDAPLSYKDRVLLGQEMALRAMFFVARETGGINGARAATIETVLWRITDSEFPADLRAALLAQSKTEGETFLASLNAERSRIAPGFPEIILGAAAQVALAEGAIDQRGEAKLRAIAQALQLEDSLSDAITTARNNT